MKTGWVNGLRERVIKKQRLADDRKGLTQKERRRKGEEKNDGWMDGGRL